MKPQKKTKGSRVTRVAVKHQAIVPKDNYVLHLFVAGATSRSLQAIQHIRTLCETILLGRVHLDVIDIYLEPMLARKNQIVATPTLIMELPAPARRFIGNLTTINDLVSKLDLGERDRIAL